MLRAIDGISNAANGKSLADFPNDWLLRHGLERGIEIISEASRSLPDEMKALHPEVPWPQVRTIGNVLRHEYHGLSDHVLWGVIVDEIPKLRMAVADLYQSLPNE